MKILHSADWHLGHRLHEQSQIEEQTLFLSWIENYIIDQGVDVLLISGDVFDTGSPSNQSLEMYYNFLVRLKATSCKSIIITGGNHDSPGTLNAPKHVLDALSIKVVGKATDNIEDEVFDVVVNGERVIVAAVPYLRDGDIRRAIAGEAFEDITDKYKRALINHYETSAHQCRLINTTEAPVIAMGHLFALKGQIADSEQGIYVGSLGHIGAGDFSDYFDYIALGHLHRSQLVGGEENIRYSGSPYILSFSELRYNKSITMLTIENNKLTSISETVVPRFREFYKVVGTMNECMEAFSTLVSNDYALIPWVEVVLDEPNTVNTDELKKAAANYPFQILKIALKREQRTLGLEETLKSVKSVRELLPTEVFKLKCDEMCYDLEASPKVWDAFNEILQLVKQQ